MTVKRLVLSVLVALAAWPAYAGQADHFVFDSQAAAVAAEQGIADRGRELLLTLGYVADAEGNIIGKRAGALDYAGQKTERWAVPRQRLDGKWVVPHPSCLPTALLQPPAAGGLTVAQYMSQGIAAPVEPYDPAWFAPAPHY